MKLFLILSLLILSVAACKKDKKTSNETSKSIFSLKHSGNYRGNSWTLDETVNSGNHFSYVYDEFLFREYNMRVWVNGGALNSGNTDSTIQFSLSVYLQYNWSDLDSTGNLPAVTPYKIAEAINNNSFEWNAPDEHKEISFIFGSNSFVGGTEFDIVNPQISAATLGNGLRIIGSVDSLSVHDFDYNEYHVTNFAFDYTIPMP